MSHADETKSLQVEASLLRLALDHERIVSQGWQAACAAKVAELAAARRECEGLRDALNEIVGATDDDIAEKIARAALAEGK